jgi:hypothetical protein
VLQEEFSDVERGPIVFTRRTIAYDVDEICECSQIPKLLSTLCADVNQIRNCTAHVDQFRDLVSASPNPTVEDTAAILSLLEDAPSPLCDRRAPIRVLPFSAMLPPSI